MWQTHVYQLQHFMDMKLLTFTSFVIPLGHDDAASFLACAPARNTWCHRVSLEGWGWNSKRFDGTPIPVVANEFLSTWLIRLPSGTIFGPQKIQYTQEQTRTKVVDFTLRFIPKVGTSREGWFVGGVRGMAFLLRLGKIIKSSQLNNFESFQGTDCNGSPVEKRCEHQKLLGQWHRV